MRVEIDERELGTILAALRHWQDAIGRRVARARYSARPGIVGLLDLATDDGRFSALTPDEVDALCERINTEQGKQVAARESELQLSLALTCPECQGRLQFIKFPDELWCPNCNWIRGYREHLKKLGLLHLDQRKLEGRPNDQQTEAGEDGQASPRPVQGAG